MFGVMKFKNIIGLWPSASASTENPVSVCRSKRVRTEQHLGFYTAKEAINILLHNSRLTADAGVVRGVIIGIKTQAQGEG